MSKVFVSVFGVIAGLMASLPSYASQDEISSNAIVLVYHRFGENDVPSTNIRLEQFDAQIKLLKEGGYNFIALPELVSRLKSGGMIADKTVAITVDDAYASVATEGWPRLKAAGIPLTVFVSTDAVDANRSRYLSWDQLRQLKDEGVHIAHHTASHLHMVDADFVEVKKDIERATARFETELGLSPKILAYPYGEYNLELKKNIKNMGFEAAFAQYSSVIHSGSDVFELPRFPVNERYGDLNRFRLITTAKAIMTRDIMPPDTLVTGASNPPVYGFTTAGDYKNFKALVCYPSHLGKAANISVINKKRVEIRFDKPLPYGRSRINCTMPAGDGRWYWLGKFFYRQGGKLD